METWNKDDFVMLRLIILEHVLYIIHTKGDLRTCTMTEHLFQGFFDSNENNVSGLHLTSFLKVSFLCLRRALWCNIGQCFFVLSLAWRCTECLCACACLWDLWDAWVFLQILHHTSCENIEYFSCIGWLLGWFVLVDFHSTFIMQSIYSKNFPLQADRLGLVCQGHVLKGYEMQGCSGMLF